MSCQNQKCKSDRLVSINAKCNDLFDAEHNDNNYSGYVPGDLGIGSGDYVEFEYCLECGHIQGDFPMQPAKIESSIDESDLDDQDDSEE